MKTLLVNCSTCNTPFQKSISCIRQGQKRGYPNHFCSLRCSCQYNRNQQTKNKNKRIEKYYTNPNKCLHCELVIPFEKRHDNVLYCSHKCAAIHGQKDGGHCHWSDEGKTKLSKITRQLWKSGVFNHLKSPKIEKICPVCKINFELPSYKEKQKCCSKKCAGQWTVKTGFLKGKTGGYRAHSGTSKKGWYNGIFCGSSWELAWVIYHLDHHIPFERNNVGFEYTFGGKTKKYYPDFKLPDKNEYVEIKNYETPQVIEKTKQFPHKLTIMYKNDLKDIFFYVTDKYGKDFVKLYESKNSH